MRRAKTLGFLIILVVYMGLGRPDTVHAQRGYVAVPPTHQGRATRLQSGTEGHHVPVPPPRVDVESPDHKRRNAETKRSQAREGHRGSLGEIFGKIFGIGGEQTTWERSGCETPREEARFRVDGAGHITETRPAGGSPLRPKACVILPTAVDAYKNVFGREPSGAEAERVRAYEEQFREQKVEVLGERRVGEDELKAWVESRARSGVRPVCVFGHSTFWGEEQVLVLPNGDRVPAVRIHQWAAEAGSECVVATCYGKDLGLTEQIGFDDVLTMWQEALGAMNEGPSLGSATLSVEDFAANLTKVRWKRGARSIDLTVSTPGIRPLGDAPASGPGVVVIWNLPMARPDRILMIAALLLSGLGLLHHTMYRVGQKPVGWKPTSSESFRRAMMAAFRHQKAYRHTGVAIAGITLLLALSTYLSGTEVFMDWQERRAGGRWQVHTASIIGASLASLASAIYLMKPGRSVLGTLSHGLGGLIVGATTAWITFFAFCPFIGVRFEFFGAVVLGTLGGIVAWVGNGSGALDGFLIGFGFLVVYGIFGGCLFAIRGLFVGWRTAVDEYSVHEATMNMVCTLVQLTRTRGMAILRLCATSMGVGLFVVSLCIIIFML